jgi:hypothetical protein
VFYRGDNYSDVGAPSRALLLQRFVMRASAAEAFMMDMLW